MCPCDLRADTVEKERTLPSGMVQLDIFSEPARLDLQLCSWVGIVHWVKSSLGMPAFHTRIPGLYAINPASIQLPADVPWRKQ